MTYELLTEDQRDTLRRERLFALEADHFRHSLLAEEDPEDRDVHHQLLRLRDRIMVHREAMATANQAPSEEG